MSLLIRDIFFQSICQKLKKKKKFIRKGCPNPGTRFPSAFVNVFSWFGKVYGEPDKIYMLL